jgi:hypothetical protein
VRRRRDVAASPERSGPQVWATIKALIGDTLERSSSIERADVDAALTPLDAVGRMLISAGHLEKRPLVLIADEMELEIGTVSGGPALTMEENLNPVPGAASAADWTLHVPQVEPMAKLVRSTVQGQAHLSADEPGAPAETSSAAGPTGSAVDLAALAHWAAKED